MQRQNRSVVKTHIYLNDGFRVVQVVGRERRRFFGLIPYTKTTTCYVPREAFALHVMREYLKRGEFAAPDFGNPFKVYIPPRVFIVEKHNGFAATCTCGWEEFVPRFNYDEPDDNALSETLRRHVAHAEKAQIHFAKPATVAPFKHGVRGHA